MTMEENEKLVMTRFPFWLSICCGLHTKLPLTTLCFVINKMKIIISIYITQLSYNSNKIM